jgi:hypothetical protein
MVEQPVNQQENGGSNPTPSLQFRPEVQQVLSAMVKNAPKGVATVKKHLAAVFLAANSDYPLLPLPINVFKESDEVVLVLHKNSCLTAEKDWERRGIKIHRYGGKQGYTFAIKAAARMAESRYSKKWLPLIMDADTCYTGENHTPKKPSLAKIREDGSIPGVLVPNPNFLKTGRGRKLLYHTSPTEKTQLTPTPKELKELILTCANIGLAAGFGMMNFPNKNNWEDYFKGGNTVFQQGLNGGGIRGFLRPEAFTAYEHLKVSTQEEDYRTNVFLAQQLGKTSFVPRFLSLSYSVFWGERTITRSKISPEYRDYLQKRVIIPLRNASVPAILVEGKGNKNAAVPRLIGGGNKICLSSR